MKGADAYKTKYGPWAVVIGGSKGIGAAYSRQLASKGLNLLIAARGEAELESIKQEVIANYQVEARTLSLDLNDDTVWSTVKPVVADIEVGLLVYNTAYYDINDFFNSSLGKHMRTLNVNCRSLLTLVYHLGEKMCARGRGGMIIMSSMSGWQGGAMLTTYAATKAFDTVLGEGLWEELRAQGVDVLSFVAGATKTPNFLTMTPKDKQKGVFPMEPDDVAREAIHTLGKAPVRRAGLINKVAGFVIGRLLPRKMAIRFMSHANRKLYGD